MKTIWTWSLVCGIAAALQVSVGVKDAMDLAAQAYCTHFHPSNFEFFDALDPVCQNYNQKQEAISFLAPFFGTADNQSHHPVVGNHAIIWYKNWMTCTIC